MKPGLGKLSENLQRIVTWNRILGKINVVQLLGELTWGKSSRGRPRLSLDFSILIWGRGILRCVCYCFRAGEEARRLAREEMAAFASAARIVGVRLGRSAREELRAAWEPADARGRKSTAGGASRFAW